MKHDVDGGVRLRIQNDRAGRPSVFERAARTGQLPHRAAWGAAIFASSWRE
jgi:hypothetical protein